MAKRATVEVDVNDIVTAHIEAQIAEALGKDPSALVAKVCEVAMKEQSKSYDRTTIFQDAINKMIREAAKETFAKWLKGQKVLIQAAIIKRLRDEEGGFVATVAEKLTDALGSSFYVTCNMKVED